MKWVFQERSATDPRETLRRARTGKIFKLRQKRAICLNSPSTHFT